jgi:hypothetical protein
LMTEDFRQAALVPLTVFLRATRLSYVTLSICNRRFPPSH